MGEKVFIKYLKLLVEIKLIMALLQVMLCNLFQHSEHENNTDYSVFSDICIPRIQLFTPS